MVGVSRWVSALGVRVVNGDLGSVHGAYMHDHHAILVNRSLGPVQRRSTLMHELGHAYYGHECTSAKSEREASLWAARQMIRQCEFARLIKVFDNPQAVAWEMGVLPRDVVNYQQWRLTVDRMPLLAIYA